MGVVISAPRRHRNVNKCAAKRIFCCCSHILVSNRSRHALWLWCLVLAWLLMLNSSWFYFQVTLYFQYIHVSFNTTIRCFMLLMYFYGRLRLNLFYFVCSVFYVPLILLVHCQKSTDVGVYLQWHKSNSHCLPNGVNWGTCAVPLKHSCLIMHMYVGIWNNVETKMNQAEMRINRTIGKQQGVTGVVFA